MKFSCNMVVLLIQICVILSIWENVENIERLLHHASTSPVLQKFSTCALDPSLFLAENSFFGSLIGSKCHVSERKPN